MQKDNSGCANCVFKHESDIDANLQRSLVCRANPPQMLMIPTPQGMQGVSMFPAVAPDMWCGQYKIKLTAH